MDAPRNRRPEVIPLRNNPAGTRVDRKNPAGITGTCPPPAASRRRTTMSRFQLDEIDVAILNAIRDDARMSHVEIRSTLASRVPPIELSETTVARRVRAMEQTGVILKYVTVIDHQRVEAAIEAYVELTLKSDVDLDEAIEVVLEWPEVREASLVTGDADLVLRIRVSERNALRAFVQKLRDSGMLQRSKTLIAIDRVRRSPARGIRRIGDPAAYDSREIELDDVWPGADSTT
ncbi:MAG: Lrp/AsnC family transcriptional regulator [Patulibacter minatonensis]